MFNKSVRKQYLAAFSVNIIAISYGGTMGWSSSNLPILQSLVNYPLETGPLTKEESSWIASFMCLGAIVGSLFCGNIVNRIGRKMTLYLLSLPQFLTWILILCNQNIYYLFLSRFLGGFTGGGMFVIIPLYIGEISDNKIRGSLSSQIILFLNFGLLSMFIAGKYLTYFQIPKVMLIVPTLYLISVIFLPETPFYLMKIKKEKEAEKSWRYFRNLSPDNNLPDLEMEMEKLQKHSKKVTEEKVKVEWKDFTTPEAIRAFIIGIGLVALCHFSGCLAMINYTATIFQESGSDLLPSSAAIVVAILQLVGSYVSTILVDHAGRKILLFCSALGTAIGLSIMGIHRYLKFTGHDVSNFHWVPVTSFSFIIFIASCGVLSLPFVVIAEVMPEKIRAIASTICMSLLACFAFIAVKNFSVIADNWGMHGLLFLFAGCSFSGAIFVAFVVPETKGKTFNKITSNIEEKNVET